MKLLPFISLFFVLLLANTTLAASVTPDKIQVTEYMNNYDLGGQNNSLQLACEIGQYVSSEYGWNCDIRQLNFTSHSPVYLNVFYPAADNKKGYEAYYGWFGPQKKEVTSFTGKDKAMYYRDWGLDSKAGCRISGVCSYGIVKSFWGNTTEPVKNVSENESTDTIEIQNGTSSSYNTENIEVNNSSNTTVKTFEMENDTVNNSVVNSSNTVINQGIIDTVKQYWFDFKNANLNNVTFNFWGNQPLIF